MTAFGQCEGGFKRATGEKKAMVEVLNFIKAAAPPAAMGLCAAILIVSGVTGKRKAEIQKNEDGNYSAEGVNLGMCFGLVFGSIFENYVSTALALGMIAGHVIGMFIPKKTHEEKR